MDKMITSIKDTSINILKVISAKPFNYENEYLYLDLKAMLEDYKREIVDFYELEDEKNEIIELENIIDDFWDYIETEEFIKDNYYYNNLVNDLNKYANLELIKEKERKIKNCKYSLILNNINYLISLINILINLNKEKKKYRLININLSLLIILINGIINKSIKKDKEKLENDLIDLKDYQSVIINTQEKFKETKERILKI